jgi:hypothetical protein
MRAHSALRATSTPERQRVGAQLGRLGGGALGGAAIAIGDRDLRPLEGEQQAGGAAEPGAAAGDDADPALKAHRLASP